MIRAQLSRKERIRLLILAAIAVMVVVGDEAPAACNPEGVGVVKVEQFTVTESNTSPPNSATVVVSASSPQNDDNPGRLYICQGSRSSVDIELDVVTDPAGNKDWIGWRVEDSAGTLVASSGAGSADPPQSRFGPPPSPAADCSSVTTTLTPSDTLREFHVKLFCDEEAPYCEKVGEPYMRDNMEITDNNQVIEIIVYVINVDLKSVTFSGAAANEYFRVLKDDLSGAYGTPHWQDNTPQLDGDAVDTTATQTANDKKFPVCYVRNKYPMISATFKCSPSLPAGVTAKIRAYGPPGEGGDIDIAEEPLTGTSTFTLAAKKAEKPFPDTIFYYDPSFDLQWQISFNGGPWCTVGTSKNPMYVLLGVPQYPTLYTVVHVSCRNASGETQAAPIRTAIWNEFADNEVNRVDRNPLLPIYGSDGAQLTYYGGSPSPGSQTHLLVKDGDSKCGGWVRFFNDCFRVQGIVDGKIVKLEPDDLFAGEGREREALWIKNFTAGPYGIGVFPTPVSPGIKGQGPADTPGEKKFCNHGIVQFGSIDQYGVIYDPSYGTKCSGIWSWETGAVAAFIHRLVSDPWNVSEWRSAPDISAQKQTEMIPWTP